MSSIPGLVYRTKMEQLDLLNTVLIANDMVNIEIEESEEEDLEGFTFTRQEGNMKSVSGADNMAYLEFSSSRMGQTSSGRTKEKRRR